MAKQKLSPPTVSHSPAADFDAAVAMIRDARVHAAVVVNTTLIDLYRRIGEHLSRKLAAGDWGDGTVPALAAHIRRSQPNVTGFSASNLWRMRQFHDTYATDPKLAALLRELSWSHNLAVLSRCKRDAGVLTAAGRPRAVVPP